MIFLAYNKNTFDVLFASLCTNEKEVRTIFEKFIKPTLKCPADDIDWKIVNMSAILGDMNKTNI